MNERKVSSKGQRSRGELREEQDLFVAQLVENKTLQFTEVNLL